MTKEWRDWPPGTCGLSDKAGWYCKQSWWHFGPCVLRPRWWNVHARLVAHKHLV